MTRTYNHARTGTTSTRERVRWQDDAACKDMDVELFYGRDNEWGHQREQRERRAKAVCFTCPVMEQCRTQALTVPERSGVWGGLGENERMSMLRKKRRKKA